MKVATIRTRGTTQAIRVDGDRAIEIGFADVGELLQRPDWRSLATSAEGTQHELETLDYATLVPKPEKILCVGLNYREHILEMGRQLPDYPTLFAKYSRALIGANDDIVLPAGSAAPDWEAELGVIIGSPVRHATTEQAQQAIAGYTVVNDVTARDWQYRTQQWLQGKTFESSTPVGPWLVTDVDSAGHGLSCVVDGETMQSADTGDLVFGPVALIKYISSIITLVPGDIIATGTPGGVGHARTPPRYLSEGQVVITRIESIGECRNTCRAEKVTTSP